jgi:hypothetical protein
MPYRVTGLILATLAAPAVALAQDKTSTPAPDKAVEEVVVTGAAGPAAEVVTSIDRRSYSATKDVAASTGTLADLLRTPAVGGRRSSGECHPARRRGRHHHHRRQASRPVLRPVPRPGGAERARRPVRARRGHHQPVGRRERRGQWRHHQPGQQDRTQGRGLRLDAAQRRHARPVQFRRDPRLQQRQARPERRRRLSRRRSPDLRFHRHPPRDRAHRRRDRSPDRHPLSRPRPHLL